MKLRGVPDDERVEIYDLFDEHGIDYYETSAGNWGISMPALWLRDHDQLSLARSLLDEYQAARYQQAREEYEMKCRYGQQRGWGDLIRDNPWRFVLYMGIVAGLIYISIVPFLALT